MRVESPHFAASDDKYSVPIPVLGQGLNSEPERRPLAATASEYLAAICVCLCILGAAIGVFIYFGDNNRHGTWKLYDFVAEALLIPAGLAAVSLALAIGLHRRRAGAYWSQLVLALFGLLALPLGTIIYGFLLIGWFQRNTQSWYGVK